MSDKKYCGGNLNKEEVAELNRLLLKNKLDLPLHRRVVDLSGRNYDWLKKNLMLKNPDVSGRLKELLGL